MKEAQIRREQAFWPLLSYGLDSLSRLSYNAKWICRWEGNQNRAKAFYTDVLGMELRVDQPLYPGVVNRWVAVTPTGAETEITLYVPEEKWKHYCQVVGKSQALTLTDENLAALHAALRAKGVRFVSQPETQPWGTFATIEDSEGNHLLLVQH